jgi:hypothetical protein
LLTGVGHSMLRPYTFIISSHLISSLHLTLNIQHSTFNIQHSTFNI